MTPLALARPSRGTVALVGAITLGALLVRSIGLSGFAITHWDEGIAWKGALYFASLGESGHYSPTQAPPLLPVLYALATVILGPTVSAAVWWNVIASTACVPLAWLVGRRLHGDRAGVFAAALLAASGLHVMYARSLLTESVYVLLLFATLERSLVYLERRTARAMLAVAVCAVLLQYTKYNGMLAAAPLGAIVLWGCVRDPATRRRYFAHLALLAGSVSVAVLANLAAIHVLADLPSFLEHYAGYVGGGGIDIGDLARLAGETVPLAVLGLALGGVLLSVARRRWPEGRILDLTLLLYVGFLFGYTFYLRLLVPVVALACLYAGLCLDRIAELRPRALGIVACGAILVVLAGTTAAIFPRLWLDRFDGYAHATAWLNELPDEHRALRALPRLFVAQEHVWTDLRERPRSGLHLDAATRTFLAENPEVLVVYDIAAFSKHRPQLFRSVLEGAPAAARLVRFDNTLNFDAIENNLTVPELLQLDQDEHLREQALGIHVLRIESAALLR